MKVLHRLLALAKRGQYKAFKTLLRAFTRMLQNRGYSKERIIRFVDTKLRAYLHTKLQ